MTSDNNIVTRLRSLANALAMGEWIALTETCATAADEIERLRAERDEARRWCCELWATDQIISQNTGMTPADYAAETGWDCFKETQ